MSEEGNVISGVPQSTILAAVLFVKIISDICWCSITEPVFPAETQVVITNSGKYAYYGKALTSRDIRFGSLNDCATAAINGVIDLSLPKWLS